MPRKAKTEVEPVEKEVIVAAFRLITGVDIIAIYNGFDEADNVMIEKPYAIVVMREGDRYAATLQDWIEFAEPNSGPHQLSPMSIVMTYTPNSKFLDLYRKLIMGEITPANFTPPSESEMFAQTETKKPKVLN